MPPSRHSAAGSHHVPAGPRSRPWGAVGVLALVAWSACQRPLGPAGNNPPPPVEACEPPGTPVHYYVDVATGVDSNPGTATQPFRTIQQAANVVNPGDTVIVRDGVYTGGSRAIVDVERCGAAGHLIVFMAEHTWGAVLDGQHNTSQTGVFLGASFIRVEGLEIRGVGRYGFDMAEGSVTDLEIAANHIHDVGRYCTDATGGISAVSVVDNNILIERNLIHDIGRYSPGENGCSPTTKNWQNHDHGVYAASGSNITIRNNVFYNILHGWAVQRYSGAGVRVDSLFILNNTFAFPNPNKDGQIIISSPTANSLIANNIFYEPLTAGIVFEGASASGVTVANNLASTEPVATGDLTGVTSTNNLDRVDPLLVNPAGFDFHLKAGSPAIGAGLSLPNVPNDFDGVPRPPTGPYDLGAYLFR
jgi:parallel beta helix pectate lyase-like protein/uncharacterized protein DUF1565